MGISKLKVPRICEQCGRGFEAKSIDTRYCGRKCIDASYHRRKKQAVEDERKQQILQDNLDTIAAIQTRPYISISEAVILFGISKDTLRRLIKRGKIPAVNLGERLTRISRVHLENMFKPISVEEVAS